MKLSIKKSSESRGHRSPIYAICHYKPNQILTGGGEGWVACWDLGNPENGKLLATVTTSVFTLVYLAEQNMIVAGDRDGGLHWIDESGISYDVFAHHKGVYGIYLFDNKLVTIGGDGYMSLWNIQTMKPIESYQFSNTALRSFLVDNEKNEILIGSSNGNIYVIDKMSYTEKRSFQAHNGAVFSMAITPYDTLLSGGKDALLKIHRKGFVDVPDEIKAHWFAIYAISIHPSGFFFATVSRDKTIRLWSLPDVQPILTLDFKTFSGHTRSVNNMLWTDDGHKLISVGDDASMIVWEVVISD
jgi:WD40 repeat protein